MTYKNINKVKYIWFVFIMFLVCSFCPTTTFAQSSGGSFDYQPMEEIPGFSKTSDFPTYIINVYKFGLWVIGISAMMMIMVGGFMYITSAGNNASMGKAKGIISDALVGLILALCSYLLLYTINPELVKFKGISAPGGGSGTTGGSGTQGTGNGGDTCGGGCSMVDDACKKNSFSIDAKVLKTIVAGGEECNKRVSSDGYGSCGYSQALPKIRQACGISGSDSETCTKIQNDVQMDINCTAWLVNEQSKQCTKTEYFKAGCCYNGGPSNPDCHKQPVYGTKLNNFYNSNCK